MGVRPLGCRLLYLLDVAKQIGTQQLITHRPVKSLDVRVLLWIARLDKFQFNPVLTSPLFDGAADVLSGPLSLLIVLGLPRHSMT